MQNGDIKGIISVVIDQRLIKLTVLWQEREETFWGKNSSSD